MRIIARSRIGFWTAFETENGSFLNARDKQGSLLTIVLDDSDAELLSGSHDVCHRHAQHLVRTGMRLATPLPTPPRGASEPEPHEWQPRKPTATLVNLKAA